ncbi:hypothetical protein ACFPT7_00220 [Acidicapsa dinghuensis]|uniref:Uncharacterized protein n=1 Tax=Acidicapsa dinghuensis TaxID=2218256 RepID=A0ABW1EBE3_9BACT|nr:hypothetical protein [Acidicapsa dinghuensis]
MKKRPPPHPPHRASANAPKAHLIPAQGKASLTKSGATPWVSIPQQPRGLKARLIHPNWLWPSNLIPAIVNP